MQRTKEGRYQIVVIAPNLGERLIKKGHYFPIFRFRYEPRGIVITPLGSGITDIKQLEGVRLALPPKQAIVSKVILKTLRQKGIDLAKINLHYQRSHNEALFAV
jgi:hypothetical protein